MSLTALKVTAWSPEPGLLSEGARWHEERQELLWVDILGCRFHRSTLTGRGRPDQIRTITLDRHIGAVAPVAAGGHVLAAGQGFLFVDEAGSLYELVQPEAGNANVRMNDGACDPQGRFWAGTMAYDESPGAGTLYRLELDRSCSTVLEGLTISNGIGWSPDGATMYLSDSGAGVVEAFDFDGVTGAIGARRTLVQIDQPGMAPDGLTVDEQGDIWIGMYGGWAVHRYAADGSLRATVHIPAAQATSCAFGGADRRTLFVTTGRERLDESALVRQPEAGRVFSVTGLDARGRGCAPYRGQVRVKGSSLRRTPPAAPDRAPIRRGPA
jgi:sugar lactone lactonase YvrE